MSGWKNTSKLQTQTRNPTHSTERTAIRAVQRLCEEALDHGTSWSLFKQLVQRRLENEDQFIETAQSFIQKEDDERV